jgi:predicted RNase H-like nuclease (RuvC/YqgF family)
LRGLDAEEAHRYIQPLRERVDRRVTPARWKHDRVADRVERGEPLGEAIWGMQAAYIDRQEETLVEGTFVDWL